MHASGVLYSRVLEYKEYSVSLFAPEPSSLTSKQLPHHHFNRSSVSFWLHASTHGLIIAPI
jgi:hypothetical protein